MTFSIQTKLLAMCVLLILLTTLVISGTYYLLTKQDKQRESRERIQIALDIVLEDFNERVEMYTTRFTEFLQQNNSLLWGVYSYTLEQEKYDNEWATIRFLFTSFQEVSNDLKAFGRAALADRVMLYDGTNRQLLVLYQRLGGEETIGSFLPSEEEGDRYLPMQDIAVQTEITFRGNNADLQYKSTPLPEVPPPKGVNLYYEDEIPDSLEIAPFSTGQTLGIRIVAPIYRREEKLGVLVGEVIYTQKMVKSYADLSRTDVNLFAGPRLSVGTLPAQQQLDPETLARLRSCADIRQQTATISLSMSRFAGQPYYQAQCAFKDGADVVGAISVNLSQAIEQAQNRRALTAILIVSGIVIAIALGLSLAFSRHTIAAIYNIVHVIRAAAEGDLRQTARVTTGDEIGSLAEKLNQMISQLRSISEQVQHASNTVNATADTILHQMEGLTQYLEQQSGSVDNTTVSVEKIKEFIDAVAVNTANLLSAAEQILSSIQESRASIAEVTTSTDALTTNLHLISQSVEQVNQAVKQITGHSEHLENVAQQTETELHQIDQSLQEVSSNADHTQQLAKETMDAATSGQSSVEASIQGMTELKDVMTNTAQIIREVNDWGAQVSSILDIVDEITEQTSLLALNASIISAQAGTHGRGFAVVADEIKNLATRTKASTTKISTLVHELQQKTTDGVQHTAEGLRRTEQGLELANTVQDALTTILERATRSSNRAADTVRVIQQTVSSGQAINTQMTSVTDMVSKIRAAIQEQRDDVEQVVAAVENLSGMSEQVNRASVEQKRAAEEIERSMSDVTHQFTEISEQTETLQADADQVVNAMHTIERATDQILDTTNTLSGETVKNLVQQSNLLQKIVKVFKVS